ncbi:MULTISPECIES: helix-turn-helix domain-containing protein [unclassified Gemella]|uniref:helix-turn-helix domain-containing protein n=1 Tax=unclassified Gemella TaxID=2624949 RepID=UPI001073AE05|nr:MULTISPECIES: helix-turn-helix transcriptional regulator [unclassified Gemella]MBF0709761.1 helix-turn-helix transcriptional regulator [Gemella sp. GL1.1]MBF0747151.1 helix-turn-helix transcriptional regulator [Gemella sp. 19428wG2_WT2a]NYS27105.1 helix-turn-helix transcriptional regulator [Gemella sp. GL1]TFU58390.1 XRE family transcriptional regulator [Gemella sp. WT2a]
MTQITLEAARVNAGYTMREVATITGVHHQTVSKYEKDSSKIPFDLMNSLCELYKISKDEIFFGKVVRKK